MQVDWIDFDNHFDPFEDYLKKHPKMPLKKAVDNYNYSIKRAAQRQQQKSKSPIKIL